MLLLVEVAQAAPASPSVAPYLIALAGTGGLLGAVLGFVKLSGDRNSQAVSQAQGAMETMQELNQALEKEVERARERTVFYQNRYDALRKEFDAVRERWGPFPADDV